MNAIKPEEANSTSIFKAFMLFSFVSRVQCPEIDLANAVYEATSARLFSFFSVVKSVHDTAWRFS